MVLLLINWCEIASLITNEKCCISTELAINSGGPAAAAPFCGSYLMSWKMKWTKTIMAPCTEPANLLLSKPNGFHLSTLGLRHSGTKLFLAFLQERLENILSWNFLELGKCLVPLCIMAIIVWHLEHGPSAHLKQKKATKELNFKNLTARKVWSNCAWWSKRHAWCK